MSFVELEPPNERQGEYVGTDLFVWYCWDDVCDCSQVKVQRIYRNALAPYANWAVNIWEGQYFTEGEGREQQKAELVQAFRDVCERYPHEKWRNTTLPDPT